VIAYILTLINESNELTEPTIDAATTRAEESERA
jgi:hypothetical protein